MPSGMVFFLICGYLLLFLPYVSSTVQISIQGQAQAQATASVGWQRAADDPPIYSLAKVKLDEQPQLTSTPVLIPNPAETSGSLLVPFNRAGIFHLLAYDASMNILSTSAQFGVLPPAGLSSGEVRMVTATATSAFVSSTALPRTTDASAPSQVSGASTRSNVPIIVSSVLGSVFFLLFVLLLFYFIRCRRVLRQRRAHTNASSWSFPNEVPYSMDPSPYSAGSTLPPDLEKRVHPPDILTSPPLRVESRRNTHGSPLKSSRRITATTFASAAGTEISSIRFNPLTGRQIELEARIHKLSDMLRDLGGNEYGKASNLRALIDQLTRLKESPYALGRTDEVPPGWR